MTTTGDLSKLPRWAQSRIGALEGDVRRLRQALEIAGGAQGSDLEWGWPGTGLRGLSAGGYIPVGEQVRFVLTRDASGHPARHIDVQFVGLTDPTAVRRVRVFAHGGGTFYVHPTAGNAVELWILE